MPPHGGFFETPHREGGVFTPWAVDPYGDRKTQDAAPAVGGGIGDRGALFGVGVEETPHRK